MNIGSRIIRELSTNECHVAYKTSCCETEWCQWEHDS